jgi:heptaprenyl diphosphate synthase
MWHIDDNKDRLVYLAALSLMLSSIEYLIPKPLPFLKLGLGNLPLLLGLTLLPVKEYFLLALLKTICQGIIGGTLVSPFFVLSFCGTFASAAVMLIFHRLLKKKVTLFSISTLGAMANNLTQLALAALLIYGKTIFIATPLLLAVGLIAAPLLGLFAQAMVENTKFYTLAISNSLPHFQADNEKLAEKRLSVRQVTFISISIAGIVASFLTSNPVLLAIGTVILLVCQKLSGRKVMLGIDIGLMISMVILSLLDRNGKVLLSLGPLQVTQGALVSALARGLRILMIMASSQILSATKILRLPLLGSIFSLSARTVARFSKTSGTLFKRIDESLLGQSDNFQPSPQKYENMTGRTD